MNVEILLLRLDAPLMSFGEVAVDERRTTGELPGRSMLTGLLANALGWLHGDFEALERLQQRLVYAVRRDRRGQVLDDFHTVDLGQDFMRQGWTTRGRVEGRGKGAATSGTHIRRRQYLADAAYTVALSLEPAEESPLLKELAEGLLQPARPLFLGRKTCLPSRPLLGKEGELYCVQAESPLAALAATPPWREGSDPQPRVWWFGDDSQAGLQAERTWPIYDTRDWRHQWHAGRRFVHESSLEMPGAEWPGPSQDGDLAHG